MVRTCAASGTKFFDLDANGRRDPDDPGSPRFLIWADYDDDGHHETSEPFTVSDDQGDYVLFDIRPPDGAYTLRETLLPRVSGTQPVATDWMCSYPNDATPGGTGSAPNGRFGCAWGPIDATTTPYAQDRDLGNWFPAQLTLEKVVEPAGDPGRFHLLVNDRIELPSAGDGDSITLTVPPGTYNVSEAAAEGTNPDDYESSVECRRTAPRRGARRLGAAFPGLPLRTGDEASCTFRNIRRTSPPVPAIAIRKTGPDLAVFGDALRYTLYVTNPGEVPFPESAVHVTDPTCDDAPELERKQDASGADDSPETLDPGDTWIYRCSNLTRPAGDACEPTRIDNAANVTGTAGETTVDDSDSIRTIMFCSERPRPPTVEPPNPPGPAGPRNPNQPGPVVPVGPQPPRAGAAGTAVFLFRRAIRGCIGPRLPRVVFEGTRIGRIRVYVNGRLERAVTVTTLQRRVRPRVTLRPGRYRIAVRVRFQRGAGTPPLTLRGTFRVCARRSQAPRVTG